jgi:hypothetical protein
VLRGIIPSPAQARPWTRAFVREELSKIGQSPELSAKEKAVVDQILAEIPASSEEKSGMDWGKGLYHSKFLDLGMHLQSDVNLGYHDGVRVGTSNQVAAYLRGDLGPVVSWRMELWGSILSIYRTTKQKDGNGPSKYDVVDVDGKKVNVDTSTYKAQANNYAGSYDLPEYFPYTFSPTWDGEPGTFQSGKYGSKTMSFSGWPSPLGLGYGQSEELSVGLLDNKLLLRIGRFRRDWGPAGNGASLVLNAQASPFLGIDTQLNLTDWFSFSSTTGFLERNLNSDPDLYQNCFSISMLQFNPFRYFSFDGGMCNIWPKHSELGYVFPLMMPILYQYSMGDYNNFDFFGDLVGRYPGIGQIWLSVFVDEMELGEKLNTNDAMYAWQLGTEINIPSLPFTTVTFRYTKVEPYCYSHCRVKNPWSGDTYMDQSYTNNGYPLGSYLGSNADEFLLRMDSQISTRLSGHIQYQLVRHGAEYGWGRVPGSSLLDSLHYNNYSGIKGKGSQTEGINDESRTGKKNFLHDGVYSWQNVLRAGVQCKFSLLGMDSSLSADGGLVFTNWSDDGFHFLSRNDSEYPASILPVIALSLSIYPQG